MCCILFLGPQDIKNIEAKIKIYLHGCILQDLSGVSSNHYQVAACVLKANRCKHNIVKYEQK